MSSSDLAISVRGLCKSYVIAREQQRHITLAEAILARLTNPFFRSRTETFWALKDVSFDVHRGDVVGIIGRNGAGKSTLLKILSRITEPTRGEIDLYGHVGSLLEVGTGFHPELSGRENIFLNGAILGMTRAEIRRQFDAIVEFAGVEKFLETPVKRYSSGMYVRLAFAVAAHLNPEILVIDEVLAVGDAEFQKKCLGKMSDVARQGRTVLFVSHNMNAVQSLCSRCIWLQSGAVAGDGEARSVIPDYLAHGQEQTIWVADEAYGSLKNEYFNPTRFELVDSELKTLARPVGADEKIGVLVEGDIETMHSALVVGFAIYSLDGQVMFWSQQTDEHPDQWPVLEKGHNRLLAWLPCHFLNEGDFRVELNISLHWLQWLCQPGVNAPALKLSIRGGLSKSPHWIAARPGLTAPVLPFTRLAT